MPNESPAQEALWNSAAALFFEFAAVACFIPPLQERVGTVSSPLMASAFGVGIGIALVLHLVFLWQTATRLGRGPWLWCALSVVLHPIGSVVALIFLGREANAERQRQP